MPHSPTALHTVPLPDGRTLNVAEYGDNRGEPMLFLHGTPGSHLLGGLIAAEARAHGFRVFAPDRPGIGFSSAHPTRTYGSFAEDIRHMLDHFGIEKTHLVGISGGGPYSLAIAARLPERLRQTVLLSPWWFPHGAADARVGLNPVFKSYEWMLRRATPLARGTVRLAAGVALRMPKKVIGNAIRHAPADDKRLLGNPAVATLLEADIAMAFRQGWEGQWRETQLCFETPDIDVTRIDHPITIYHGAEDNIVPLHYAEKLAAQMPHATLKIDSYGGHFVALRLQEHVFDLLNEKRGI